MVYHLSAHLKHGLSFQHAMEVGVGTPSVGVVELNMVKRKFPTLARQENGRRAWVCMGMRARERTRLWQRRATCEVICKIKALKMGDQ